MERFASTLAGNRAGGGPALRDDHTARRGACADRPMPIASSIRWIPVAATAAAELAGAAHPIFITQRALGAVHDHVAVGEGGASLGLLLGELVRCPDTGVRYTIIETTLPLAWHAGGEHAKPVLQEAVAAAAQQVQVGGRQLVGWYHSHELADTTLSPSDIDAHLTLRDQPWQVALVLVTREPPLGAFYRYSADAAWSSDPLPFYELLDEVCLLPDGRKVTDLGWQTYRTDEDVLPSDRVPRGRAALAPPPAPLGPLVLFPDEVDEPLEPKPVARVVGHRARFAVYGLTAVLVAAGVVTLFQVLAARRSPLMPAGTREIDSPSALQPVDRTADTLALAIAAFDDRARLFAQRQMTCPELAHGLVEVEQRWIAYNAARSHALVLDSTRDARDLSGYAAVNAVERRFERSRCPRP